MRLKKEEVDILFEIINFYIINNNTSVYSLDKQKILSRKTLNKILKKDCFFLEEKTLKKILTFPNLDKESKEKIRNILRKSNLEKKSKKLYNDRNIIQELLDKIILLEKENEKLKKQDLSSLYPDLFKNSSYLEKRKIGSFNSDVESRTLLMKKMWEFNDEIFKKWSEVKLLLDINNKKDNVKMKKGLLSISKTLKEISLELEKSTFDSNDLKENKIIDLEE